MARLLDVAEDPRNATERMKTSLEHAVHVLSERYDELYATLRELKRKEKDEETREFHEKNLHTLNGNFRGLEERLLVTLNAIDAHIAAKAQPDPNAPQPPPPEQKTVVRKGAHDLPKPFTLTKDHSPTELRDWVDRLRDFFAVSGLRTQPAKEQQAHFKALIDTGLAVCLKPKLTAEMPVFDEDPNVDTCITLLEAEFLLRYPLVTRRYDFFRYAQGQSQSFSEYYAHLRELGDLASLEMLTTKDLYIFRLIGGLRDQELRKDILELPELTLEHVERHGRAHESAQNALKGVAGASPSTSAHATTSGQNYGNAKQGWKKKMELKKKLLKEGKCFSCGRSHDKDCPCPAKNKECRSCKKKGHFSHVCLAGLRHSASRPSSRTASPTRSSSQLTINHTHHVRGSRPTPKLEMAFQAIGKGVPFRYNVTPDTGSSRTIIALNLMTQYGWKYDKEAAKHEKLYNASKKPMRVNGTVHLSITYNGTRIAETDALVSSDLTDEILISWHDLEELGVVSLGKQAFAAFNREEALTKLKADFKDVLSDTLNDAPMLGEPMHIHLRPDLPTKPRRVLTTSQTPLHLQDAAERALKTAIADKIIVPVDTAEPSTFISRGFFVPKPNAQDARLVVDYGGKGGLNEFIERPVHPFIAGADLLKNIHPSSKVFAKLDALHGYYQIPLDEESSKLTTFLLPSGRYRFLRAPMGLSASSDEWCYRSDHALHGLPGVLKLVDDILVQAPDYATLFERLDKVMSSCREHNITLSLKKLEIGDQVKFAGFVISADGILADPEKLKAIAAFPEPTDVTGVRSFLGLANQLGMFLPNLADLTHELRQLLRKNTAFVWTPDIQHSFDAVKKALTSALIVRPFDPNLQTEMLTDASCKNGLGFALTQRDNEGKISLIQCGSHSLHPAETRYAVTELECLAIHYAITKCRHYLLGAKHFRVLTDNRPLEGTFTKPIDTLENARLQSFREKLAVYNFEVKWVEGKSHYIADALSRAPVDAPEDIENVVNVTMKVAEDPQLQMLYDAAADDQDYAMIIAALLAGKDCKLLGPTHPARAYSSVWNNLSIYNDTLILLDGHRIVVPEAVRKNILDILHVPHCGQTKTKEQARQLYYWPTMNADIKTMIEKCTDCRKFLPSMVKEPLVLKEATCPMESVSVDLYHYGGKTYIAMTDRYSGFIWTTHLKQTVTSAVTQQLDCWFRDWGRPCSIRTDGGPQFRSEFEAWCENRSISLDGPSSPHYHQSNGLAENAVKQCKYLLAKYNGKMNGQFFDALAEYRNTPRADGYSATQLYFGRRQRGMLPMLATKLQFNADTPLHAHAKREQNKKMTKCHYDATATPHSPLITGQSVSVQNPFSLRWEDVGQITDIRNDGRSYVVDIAGKKYLRNRRFLRPVTDAEEYHSNNPATITDAEDRSNSPTTPMPILRRSERIKKKQLKVHFAN